MSKNVQNFQISESNSCTTDDIHKKVTAHNEVNSEVTFEGNPNYSKHFTNILWHFDGHQNKILH